MSHRPPNEKRRTGEGAALPNQGSQFSRRADNIVDEHTELRKRAARFADLKERLARVGATLIRATDGYVIVCGAFTRHCGDLTTVADLLDPRGSK